MSRSCRKVLLQSNSAIQNELYRIPFRPCIRKITYYRTPKACGTHPIIGVNSTIQASLLQVNFFSSPLCMFNEHVKRSFSSLSLDSHEPQLENGSQTEEVFNEIAKCIQDTTLFIEDTEALKLKINDQVKLLSDDHVLEVIKLLAAIQTREKYHASLFYCIDYECLQRAKSWEPATILKVLHKLNLVFPYQSSKFTKHCVSQFTNSLGSLNTPDLLAFLLAVRRGRRFPTKLDRGLLEKRVNDVLDEFSLSELGAVCAAYFECKEGIRNMQLIDRLVEKLVENADQMDERTIGSMLKLFRKSSFDSTNYSKRVIDLQRTLQPYVTKWGPMVLIQLASVGSNLLFFHHSTIERVTQKFVDCMLTARVKDLERVAMVTAISCHRTPTVQHFWDLVEIELTKNERQHEIREYAHSFVSLVAYAIMSNVCPEKLVKMALDQDVVQAALSIADESNYNSTKRELVMLTCSLEIEHPGYDGPKLTAEEIQQFSMLYQRPLPESNQSKLTNHDRFLLALYDTAKEMFTDASFCYVQPHFSSPDVVLTYQENNSRRGNAVNQTKKIALVAGSRNMYSRFRCSPMGPFQMKTRQLKTLGYTVIPVPWFEFLPLSPTTRVAYLDKKIRWTASRNIR